MLKFPTLMCTLNFYLTFFFLLWIPPLDSRLRSVRLTTNLNAFMWKKFLKFVPNFTQASKELFEVVWSQYQMIYVLIKLFVLMHNIYIFILFFQVGIKCKRISLLFYESFFKFVADFTLDSFKIFLLLWANHILPLQAFIPTVINFLCILFDLF